MPFKANYRKITCINGAVIDFKGLDDNQTKGISGYKRVTCLTKFLEMEFAGFFKQRLL
jgi:hypothetical protein